MNRPTIKRPWRRRPGRKARDAELLKRLARIEEAVGSLIDPRAAAYAEHEARPLTDHIADYANDLLAKGATPRHVAETAGRMRRLAALSLGANLKEIVIPRNAKHSEFVRYENSVFMRVKSARLSDLGLERVQEALAALRGAGVGLATCNHYRKAAKAFSKWCFNSHRMREDVLRGLTRFNERTDVRRVRRSISLDELRRLVAAAERGPVVLGMTGQARALCYRLAVATGFRFSEIRSIRRESFDWDGPSVRVTAAFTKNGQEAVHFLAGELAADLRPFVVAPAKGGQHDPSRP